MELWKKKIAILYISTCDLPRKLVGFPGLVQSQERRRSWNSICPTEERFSGWRPGAMEGATVCWEVSAQDQTVNLCACQRISLSGEIPPVFMVLFVVSKCFKVSTKAFMRSSGDITCCLAISVENQRAAVRIWEFLFSSLHLKRYIKVTALRKTFLYLGLYQEKCQAQ